MLDLRLTDQRPGVAQEPRDDLPWIEEALRLYVTRGDAGKGLRARIIAMMHRAGDVLPSTLPWCGVFVGHCIRSVRDEDDLPFLEARARPWKDFGIPVEPQYGAILVFWRLFPGSPFGHVGFCMGETENSYLVLGGNQRGTGQMRLDLYPKKRLASARWPEKGPRPIG